MIIEIEELVGNAFVSYLKKTGKRVMSIRKIEDFANSVVEDLKKHKIKAELSLSRNQTNEFFHKYSKWFSYQESEKIVILKDEISEKDLIEEFSGYLSLPVLAAFRNENNIEKLL